MKSMLKKLVISFATAICTVCAFAGALVSFNDDKAVVSAETTIAAKDFWVSGSDIRLVNDADGAGLRFHTHLASEYYASVTESGTLLIPEHLYDGELTLEDMNNASSLRPVKAVTTGTWQAVTLDGEDFMKSTAYIYNLPAKGFGWRMVTRSYVKLADGTIAYSPEARASISDVASAILDDANASAHLKFQAEPFVVNTVNVTIVDLYGNETTSAVAYGSKLVVPES